MTSGKPDPAELYLELLKRTLTRTQFPERWTDPPAQSTTARRIRLRIARRLLAPIGLHPARQFAYRDDRREEGLDRPPEADTMIGLARLDNLHHCIRTVVRDGVEGDLIETGVWRGGATIFMRAALAAYGDESRSVWVADSFQGLPPPNEEAYPADRGDEHWKQTGLAISRADVAENFRRYGLLDDRVKFLEGWFKDTLPTAPIDRLSIVRLDGDMYESTMDGLVNLYPRLTPGGFLIVDDYGAVDSCRQAVADYRKKHRISETIEPIDWTGVFWRRT